MPPVIIGSFEEFEQHNGQSLGMSEYFHITQEQINIFAKATHDHQWIHTDPERAKAEGCRVFDFGVAAGRHRADGGWPATGAGYPGRMVSRG